MKNKIVILGIRGIPAKHGGFETFAEQLSLYLVEKNWDVTVYCQEQGSGPIYSDSWNGVKRVNIPIANGGAFGTIKFDLKAAIHAKSKESIILVLGYNTAIFNIIQRFRGQPCLINMDGIEWRRSKWSRAAKAWFWMNDWLGCLIGNKLIADHPLIAEHLESRVSAKKIKMIPYGGVSVGEADISLLKEYDVRPREFSVVIARPEPENSILEIVEAYSKKSRNHTLLVLGNFDVESNDYHRRVQLAGSAEVKFIGAIYEKKKVEALRHFSQYYIHGHTVGGTNPSLVEAMGARCAIIAHDNKFNRWVAGEGALYFDSVNRCSELFDSALSDSHLHARLSQAAYERFTQKFTWPQVLSDYESLFLETVAHGGSW